MRKTSFLKSKMALPPTKFYITAKRIIQSREMHPTAERLLPLQTYQVFEGCHAFETELDNVKDVVFNQQRFEFMVGFSTRGGQRNAYFLRCTVRN